jgi:hypothetical protein
LTEKKRTKGYLGGGGGGRGIVGAKGTVVGVGPGDTSDGLGLVIQSRPSSMGAYWIW